MSSVTCFENDFANVEGIAATDLNARIMIRGIFDAEGSCGKKFAEALGYTLNARKQRHPIDYRERWHLQIVLNTLLEHVGITGSAEISHEEYRLMVKRISKQITLVRTVAESNSDAHALMTTQVEFVKKCIKYGGLDPREATGLGNFLNESPIPKLTMEYIPRGQRCKVA